MTFPITGEIVGSMSDTRKDRVVARKPTWIALSVIVPSFFAILTMPAILTPGALIHNVPDALFFSFIMGLGSFLAWPVAWNSKIRATPDALFVDNIYVVHEIPWRRVRDIVLGTGEATSAGVREVQRTFHREFPGQKNLCSVSVEGGGGVVSLLRRSVARGTGRLRRAGRILMACCTRPTRLPGPSPIGDAVVIVSGQAALAVRGDQGGSIRLPTAWSGRVGLKPAYGPDV